LENVLNDGRRHSCLVSKGLRRANTRSLFRSGTRNHFRSPTGRNHTAGNAGWPTLDEGLAMSRSPVGVSSDSGSNELSRDRQSQVKVIVPAGYRPSMKDSSPFLDLRRIRGRERGGDPRRIFQPGLARKPLTDGFHIWRTTFVASQICILRLCQA
jgi:hypothetical protein